MSIGWRDPDAPENQIETPRVPMEEFAQFHE
jgi:hypothetical protein